MAPIALPARAVLGGALCFVIACVFTKRLSGSGTPLAMLFCMIATWLDLRSEGQEISSPTPPWCTSAVR